MVRSRTCRLVLEDMIEGRLSLSGLISDGELASLWLFLFLVGIPYFVCGAGSTDILTHD